MTFVVRNATHQGFWPQASKAQGLPAGISNMRHTNVCDTMRLFYLENNEFVDNDRPETRRGGATFYVGVLRIARKAERQYCSYWELRSRKKACW
jgi:hypothetical protein